MRTRRRPTLRLLVERLDDRCLLSGFTPAQVTRAYGLDAVTFAGGTVRGDGSGQTIAIVEAYHNPNLLSDLNQFNAAFALPDPAVSVVNLGGSTTSDEWAIESALDVEWAHAIAPGAKILVVEARSDSIPDLLAAVDVARATPGVATVSMSFGFAEAPGQSLYDTHFTTPAGHQGVSFFTASGDLGAGSGAEWPATSPNVVSVGGTSLTLNDDGSIAVETAWHGSGGGLSLYVPEPTWQRSIQSTGLRTTPDVAFLGDPATGVAVYTTYPSTGRSTWQTMGGTSLGAPAWAAIVAIVDQGLTLAGKATLDGETQTLPALYALTGGQGGDFRAIGSEASPLNLVTGLGAPAGARLAENLAATPFASELPPAAPVPAVPPTPAPFLPLALRKKIAKRLKLQAKRMAAARKALLRAAHRQKVTRAEVGVAAALPGSSGVGDDS